MRTWGLLFSALLLAGGGCATSSEAPAAPEFFTLPMTAGAADPQPDLPTRPPREGEVQGYTIELLISKGGNRVHAPTLTVYAGQRANITISNQISFIQDFDIGRDNGVAVADPIIGIIQEGLTVDLVAKPTEAPDRVALLFTIVNSDLERPIPTRSVTVAGKLVEIQLPSLVFSQMAGSSVVPAGVHSFLTRIPGPEGELDLTVRAVPVALPKTIGHAGEPLDMTTAEATKVPDVEASAEEIMRRAAFERPQAPETGWLRISLLRLDAGKRIKKPSHMQRAELTRRLTALSPETLKTFVIPAGSVSGTEADFILQRSYVRDYDIVQGMGTQINGPVVDTFRVGFEATLVRDEEGAAVQYGWSTLQSMESFTTMLGFAADIVIDVPEIVGRTGKLALRADANLTPVADLKDGRSIALLVERVPDP
ncbi:MAG: hypothetical protein O7C98_15140 [Planctomycetota bacterium]|nr:hypothetical protein [Planctomycetota bacterium]